jgi:anaerobic ribonucleoside-triphosphate reductase activating protein
VKEDLNVALVVPRTEAEGPGVRYAIWVQGCPMRCEGCCNPEMLPFVERSRRSVDAIIKDALAADVEGVTFLGGEPFSQARALADVAEAVRKHGLSVMVFSGYALEELRGMSDVDVDRLLRATDLLVDGRYEAGLRTTSIRWIGSTNQVMHFLTPRYAPHDPRFRAPNHIELRTDGRRYTLNGWPARGAKTR